MQSRLQRIYVETSAVNALRQKLNWADAVATKAHLNIKGKGWYISPVVLWEIMATEDEAKRESLIFLSQHLFEETLLPSPEELIISYIAKGFPLVEREHDLAAKGNIADVWKSICQAKQTTLIYSKKDHAKITGVIRNFGAQFKQFWSHRSINLNANPGAASLQMQILDHMRRFNTVDQKLLAEPISARLLGLTGFLIVIFICGCAGLDGKTMRRFWERLDIDDPGKRVAYALTELKPLFVRGPVFLMASMCAIQSEAKSNRGMIFDCMHSIYAIYSDMFLSADNHFRKLREYVKSNHGPKFPIFMFDELKFTSIQREVPMPGSIIIES